LRLYLVICDRLVIVTWRCAIHATIATSIIAISSKAVSGANPRFVVRHYGFLRRRRTVHRSSHSYMNITKFSITIRIIFHKTVIIVLTGNPSAIDINNPCFETSDLMLVSPTRARNLDFRINLYYARKREWEREEEKERKKDRKKERKKERRCHAV